MSYARLISSTSLPESIPVAPLESARFSLRVGRMNLGSCRDARPGDLMSLVTESGLDVVILRYPADAVTWFAQLRSDDYVAIHADTLVYYRRPLVPPPAPLDGCFTQRLATEDDLDTVASMIADMFLGYGNHYLSNPLFPREAVLAGYEQWASHHARGAGGTACVMLEDRSDGSTVGIATTETGPPGEIALAGLASEHRGLGRYPVLLQAAAIQLSRAGCVDMYISTQIHNVRAIRSWSSSGFVFDAAFQTVHLVRRALLPATETTG